MSRPRTLLSIVLLLLVSSACILASDGGWLRKVPPADHERSNPYAGDPEAVRAGGILFAYHCAQCHGENALGVHGHPSLRTQRIAKATDGDLAWLLRNGELRKGMPSWSTLPEPQRWQIIAYLRSLPQSKPN